MEWPSVILHSENFRMGILMKRILAAIVSLVSQSQGIQSARLRRSALQSKYEGPSHGFWRQLRLWQWIRCALCACSCVFMRVCARLREYKKCIGTCIRYVIFHFTCIWCWCYWMLGIFLIGWCQIRQIHPDASVCGVLCLFWNQSVWC